MLNNLRCHVVFISKLVKKTGDMQNIKNKHNTIEPMLDQDKSERKRSLILSMMEQFAKHCQIKDQKAREDRICC